MSNLKNQKKNTMTEIEEVYYRERMIEGMVESNRLTYQCKTTGQVARLVQEPKRLGTKPWQQHESSKS